MSDSWATMAILFLNESGPIWEYKTLIGVVILGKNDNNKIKNKMGDGVHQQLFKGGHSDLGTKILQKY